ncbi:MAG: hypothetical protein ACSLE9_00845 [Burkholderiaceae bacterium]
MPSANITESRSASSRQLTLELDDTLVNRYRGVRDVVLQGVYSRGLKTVAADLDLSPGNLSVALSDDPHRKFSVDDLERYVQCTGDKTPIYYLIARYLGDEGHARDHALGQVAEILQNLPAMLHAAGLQAHTPKRGR